MVLINCSKSSPEISETIVNEESSHIQEYSSRSDKMLLKNDTVPVLDFPRERIATIDVDSLNQLAIGLDLECYDLCQKDELLDSLYKNYKYHNQLVKIKVKSDSIVEYYLRGYLISFMSENDSIYRLEHISDGEVGPYLHLVTLDSEFKEIDRVNLSSIGGDEEDYFRSNGCYQSANEYLREDFVSTPVVSEAIYEEQISIRRLTIKSDGEIYEEILSTVVDTISTLLEAGDYKHFNGESLLRILPQKKIQLLTYDENGQVLDSLFGWYNYYSRQPFAEIELLRKDTDEYGVQIYTSMVDTVEVIQKWSCLEYKKERYYRN